MVTGENTACGDTSFLFALHATEVHTAAAVTAARQADRRLVVTCLNEYELANAFRLAVFRRILSSEQAANYLLDFRMDIASGVLTLASCHLPSVVDEAKRLSAAHTASGGYRGFDILHVAMALCLDADEFLSFDARQRELAAAEGLIVGPQS